MDSYSLFFKRSAERELRGVPKTDLSRIFSRIKKLLQDPRPPGCEKLSNQERYRIREGDYRIVYSVDDDAGRIEVVKVGHRREVYRK